MAWGTWCFAKCRAASSSTRIWFSRSTIITSKRSRGTGSGTLSRGATAGASGSTSTASSFKSMRVGRMIRNALAHSPNVCTSRCGHCSSTAAGTPRRGGFAIRRRAKAPALLAAAAEDLEETLRTVKSLFGCNSPGPRRARPAGARCGTARERAATAEDLSDECKGGAIFNSTRACVLKNVVHGSDGGCDGHHC